MTIDTKQLVRIANSIKTGWELSNSKWKNCEAETIVCQTLCACKNNLKTHGDAFSWATDNALHGMGGNGLVDNARGVRTIGEDLIVEPYVGNAKPKDPEGIATNEAGQYLVFRPTQKLLDYCEKFIKENN